MTLSKALFRFWRTFRGNDVADLLARIGLLLSGVAILNATFTNWKRFPIASNGAAGLLIAISCLFGVFLILLPLFTRGRAVRCAFLIPIAVAFVVVSNSFMFLLWGPRYGSDALAFLHYSALLTIQGRNPFQESMLPAINMFGLSPFIGSPLETGQFLDRTPYPALSFLIYVPAIGAGVTDLRPVSVVFHVAAILILYFRIRGPMRYVAPLTLVFTQDLLDLTPGGSNDIIWLVPTILMALDMGRVPRAAIWYGIACSIKLTPLFVGPFLLVWYYMSSTSDSPRAKLRNPVLFLAVSSMVFLATNLPYIVVSPGSWLSSVASPFAAPVVVYGSGFSGLGQFGYAPLPRISYTITAVFIFLVLLSALIFRFERFKHAIWFFPPIVLFFAPRSIHHYFIYWYPLAFLALTEWAHEIRNRTD